MSVYQTVAEQKNRKINKTTIGGLCLVTLGLVFIFFKKEISFYGFSLYASFLMTEAEINALSKNFGWIIYLTKTNEIVWHSGGFLLGFGAVILIYGIYKIIMKK